MLFVVPIYRHPNDNILSYDNFLDYLESCLSKLSNENKEVYLCGDFNSDLLKLDKVYNYKDIYELFVQLWFFTADSSAYKNPR